MPKLNWVEVIVLAVIVGLIMGMTRSVLSALPDLKPTPPTELEVRAHQLERIASQLHTVEYDGHLWLFRDARNGTDQILHHPCRS